MQYIITILYFLCFCAIAVLIAAIYTARTPKVSYIGVSVSYKIKAVHLSDIHINLTQVSAKKLQNKLLIISPDVIFITGDLAEHARDLPRAIKYLKTVCGSIPTYICLGNHEYKAFAGTSAGIDYCIEQLNTAGFFCVKNGSFICTIRNTSFNVAILDDKRCGSPDVNAVFSHLNANYSTVALCHNPDTALDIAHTAAKSPSLILCGHFHGGQIWMPFGIEYKHFRHEKILKLKHFQGMKKHYGVPVYISRGIGNVIVPFRLGSFPEIAVFYLDI